MFTFVENRRTLSSARVGALPGYWTLDDNGATWLVQQKPSGGWIATTVQYGSATTVGGDGVTEEKVQQLIVAKAKASTLVDGSKPIDTAGYSGKEMSGGAGIPSEGGDSGGSGLVSLGVAVGVAGMVALAVRAG